MSSRLGGVHAEQRVAGSRAVRVRTVGSVVVSPPNGATRPTGTVPGHRPGVVLVSVSQEIADALPEK